jgi:5-methylcytosine-specific restriction endonuclease McrA
MTTNINLFLQLSSVNKQGISRFVNTNEFINQYAPLKLGNGGSWCRFDGKFGKKYKVTTIKNNGKILFSWDDENEKSKIDEQINKAYQQKQLVLSKGNSIKYIKLWGFQNNTDNRPISEKIKKYYKNKCCVVCGSYNNTIIDHKNGLYNDICVLNVKTQRFDDFQVLCNHCNLQKRQTIKDMKNTGKRYSALNIPSISVFNIAFTQGNETYDKNDPNWGIGTFWYDPIDFYRKLSKN